MRKIKFLAASLAALLMFAACAASPFEGRWTAWPGEPSKFAITYIFMRGGQGELRDHRGYRDGGDFNPIGHLHPFSWRTEGDMLQIHFAGSDAPLVYHFEFADEKTIIMAQDTWPDGTTITLMYLD